MNASEENTLYRAAIETFGIESQYDMLIEEMAELTQAILKNRRRNMGSEIISENLHEEFADVEIVMAQIKTKLLSSRINFWKEEKLLRLKKRVEEHGQS